MIQASLKAQQYLSKLLIQQKKGTQIRIFIKNLGKIHAKCGICYTFPNEKFNTHDIIIKFKLFSIYFNKAIKPFIHNTKIDIISNKLGEQLTIHSPNLHNPNHNNTTNCAHSQQTESLEQRIENILNLQINPQLAMHGGSVSLITITKELVAVIQFHGGCNGCAMSYYTIKSAIETTLKKLIPELSGVIDGTTHQHGKHSFY